MVAFTATLAAVLTASSVGAVDSEKIAALSASVYIAYRDAIARNAALPPARSDAERLVRLKAVDQAGRTAFSTISFDGLTEPERTAARITIFNEISAHDLSDLEQLKTMLPKAGWFRISEVGKDAATAAFLIAQHAYDLSFQKEVLERMKPLFGTTDLDGRFYGLLFDRVSLTEGRPQTYGSQVSCQGGRYEPRPMADPARVDERRRAAGFTETEAQYLARFKDEPCH